MRIFITCLTLLLTITGFSQDYKFGKVSKEELQEAIHPIDSSASAAFLYKNRRTHFEYFPQDGFKAITEVHERIKIYNQEGFEYATKQILLYKSRNNEEEVNGLKAYTYNLIDGKIIEDKLDKKAVFNTEASKYRNEEKFTMPNIKNGCVIEYRYKIVSPFISNIDEYVFQEDIPIKKLEAIFEAPEYFVYKKNIKGYLNVTPQTERKNDKFIYHGVTNNDAITARDRERYTKEINFVTNKDAYELSDIPALKEEPYVNNIDNYRSGVKYELSYTQYPNSTVDYYSTTWEDVVKSIYDSSNFGGELDNTSYFKKDVEALIGSVSDPVKRAYLIFDYVKSRMTWNNYHSVYTNKGVKGAYKDHVGNVAEINLMLTSMLRYAGLRAYPVLVSTRSHGVPLFPTREGYNYVVSCVRFPEGDMLLDATSKYAMPNILPTKTLNWQGRMISEHGGSTLIDLYPSEKSKNNIFMMANLQEDGVLKGGYRSMKTNHNALDFRDSYIGVNLDDYLERLENSYDGMEISDYKVVNDLDLSKPVSESYKFVKESQADVIGDKIYFSPMFFLRSSENPFKLENRAYPVDFAYPSETNYKIIITIPEGYQIESVPEPVALMLPDDLGVFKYNILAQGKNVQLAVEAHVNQSVITPEYYAALKAYFSQLVEKQGEQIVLSKT
ncbi:DUF3857 domain-containing protein [Tamlana haliotis]|uniref:DUF3857 domain-containing protein n=1 Tax=Pseudotamlana haliotis TaxID=2614804 RepID=A0A6N6MGE7_9FLAO|nr:DUF3857 domain-containing protein [Tamlana haliotis]KAB1068462.1 DUF3857 domain-containing protein [Tamlana haliotis]